MDTKEVRKLLLQYSDIVKKLKEQNVITTGNVVGSYGEYVVRKKLKLYSPHSPTNKYIDAIDDKGLKYQIKSRKATTSTKPTLFPMEKNHLKYTDFVIYIEFDNDWKIVELLKIPSNEVNPNKNNRVPLNKSIKKYSILEKGNKITKSKKK